MGDALIPNKQHNTKEKGTVFLLFRIITILFLGFGIVSLVIPLTNAQTSQANTVKSYIDEASNEIESAKDQIENAEKKINRAKSSGIDVSQAESTLSEAKHLLSMSQEKFEKANSDYYNENYGDATHFAKSASMQAEKALNLAKESITFIPNQGIIILSSNPSDASVYLNGDYKGKTPLELSVSPGTYTIKVTMTGYEDYMKMITVKSGEEVYENVTLVLTPIPTKKSLNYLLITLIFLGVIALTTIVLHREKISIGRLKKTRPRR